MGLSRNTNAEEVMKADRAKKEGLRQEAAKKKEKDKADREKQKQQREERKEKEKKRTMKGEKKRWFYSIHFSFNTHVDCQKNNLSFTIVMFLVVIGAKSTSRDMKFWNFQLVMHFLLFQSLKGNAVG